MIFDSELEFEKALIEVLKTKGWENEILNYSTEKELIDNWAKILFDNNRNIDRLNDYPLTVGEMQQILNQINTLATPLKLNNFINGKTITIKRDNVDDKAHFGKEISLKIYDRQEIAGGKSRYQIARQPRFFKSNSILNDRRGDLMLLINGMPVIHIELKRTNVPISQAYYQIEKYVKEGIFRGIFSLIQVFVAMTPEETRYFANFGDYEKINRSYYFKWADFNNEPINDWKKIASTLLSIPMAHQLIGFYTIADENDGNLKVMRSYQYYAANAISDKVTKIKWRTEKQLGGFIWHTTGSGKTMTSFKSAQLISQSNEADKVIFLMDRIELGIQSLEEYRGFAGEGKQISNELSAIKATENTISLINKLESDSPLDTLIVTSIQKASRITADDGISYVKNIEKINEKRLIFIVDEAHRSTFGEMLIAIKETFPNAIFFGFTGTPIYEENQKKKNTTSNIFGDELHRYSIADGIRDGNVLGFDPYKVMTFRDKDLREVVALEQAKAKSIEEIFIDPNKKKKYYEFMDSKKIKMYGYRNLEGKYIKGIEDYISKTQYENKKHQKMVINDIVDNWVSLSHNSKFHSIFATSSIKEAIEYYYLFKEKTSILKVTCLFDPTIDNNESFIYKEEGLVKIIEDYNRQYKQNFSLSSYISMKKDIATRLSHKGNYKFIHKEPDKQIDLLIVVDQMLTGFDSKWINTLYLDKILEYENIIQAFSRTNRLFGPEKPFGTIKYYRKPHTMERNIKEAFKLYSGEKPIAVFANKLQTNLEELNKIYLDIKKLFDNEKIEYFSKLPSEEIAIRKFIVLFKKFNEYLEAARIQGFNWNKLSYTFVEKTKEYIIDIIITEEIYLILVQRYKEIPRNDNKINGNSPEIPFDIDSYITEIDTGKIDAELLENQFEKFLKNLDNGDETSKEIILNELHKSFATLTFERQKYANLIIHDIQSGDFLIEKGKTLEYYITKYQKDYENININKLAKNLGINSKLLTKIMIEFSNKDITKEISRLDVIKNTVDIEKAKDFFEKKEKKILSKKDVNRKIHNLLIEFILKGGFDIEK